MATPPALDGTVDAALRLAVPLGHGPVLLTFGDSKIGAMLDNFVAHASAAGAPFVIGAVDGAAFDLFALKRTVAIYKTPLALDASYQIVGDNSHASKSWQKFAAMRVGEIARIVGLGFDVMQTDVDVVWLRNPAPYITCASDGGGAEVGDRAEVACGTLRAADVAVSSDNMSPKGDLRGGVAYAAGGTFNTGIVLLRATPAGKAFAAAWHAQVIARACGKGQTGNCQAGSCCTSDQQVFNKMVRDEAIPYPGLVAPRGGGRTVRVPRGNATLGALPLALFIHGHGYFVQSAHEQLRVAPYAVHATYSLDRHDGLAKAQRFREAGLWRADPPGFGDGRFLAYNSSASPELQRARDAFTARGESVHNVAVHLAALRSHAAELRDVLALGAKLGRTVVLPRWACHCDRLWSGSDDIFHFGCMYPGAQDGAFLPFVCPMDHVLSPAEWEQAGQPHRDAAFLEQLPPASIAEVRIADQGPPGATTALGGGALDPARPSLSAGLSDAEAARRLQPLSEVAVLRLSRGHGLLCGLEDPTEAAAVNARARKLLRPPSWCSTCFQPCATELKKWLDDTAIAAGADGPKRWCAHFEPPPPLPSAEQGCRSA